MKYTNIDNRDIYCSKMHRTMHVQSSEYINYCLLCPEAIPSNIFHSTTKTPLRNPFYRILIKLRVIKFLVSISIPPLHLCRLLHWFLPQILKEPCSNLTQHFRCNVRSVCSLSQELAPIGCGKSRHTSTAPSGKKQTTLQTTYILHYLSYSGLTSEGWTI